MIEHCVSCSHTYCLFSSSFSIFFCGKLHCADEDVVEGAVYILKSVILKPNHSSGNGLTDSRQMDAVLPLLLHLLDERDGTARAVVMLIAECCSMYSFLFHLSFSMW
jgi:hypothetical protein